MITIAITTSMTITTILLQGQADLNGRAQGLLEQLASSRHVLLSFCALMFALVLQTLAFISRGPAVTSVCLMQLLAWRGQVGAC